MLIYIKEFHLFWTNVVMDFINNVSFKVSKYKSVQIISH